MFETRAHASRNELGAFLLPRNSAVSRRALGEQARWRYARRTSHKLFTISFARRGVFKAATWHTVGPKPIAIHLDVDEESASCS